MTPTTLIVSTTFRQSRRLFDRWIDDHASTLVGTKRHADRYEAITADGQRCLAIPLASNEVLGKVFRELTHG